MIICDDNNMTVIIMFGDIIMMYNNYSNVIDIL
jgi:hypothetical protein